MQVIVDHVLVYQIISADSPGKIGLYIGISDLNDNCVS